MILNKAKYYAKETAKAPIALTANAVKSTAKTVVSKLDPFNKPINKNDVTDTGVEGIRLAKKTVKDGKKGITTVKNSVKTVGKTIKTTQRAIKTANKAIRATGKAIYRTTIITARLMIKTIKLIAKVIINLIALATNPIFLVIAALLIIVVVLAASFMLLMGGGTFGSSTNGKAQAGAVGLGDVITEYDLCKEYFRRAVENNKSNFNMIIDSLYYDYDDLVNSDIAYMERFKSESDITIYKKSFATDYQKRVLKDAWTISITENEALTLAYVYLEKQLNDENSTTRQIYEIEYRCYFGQRR